MKYLHEYRDTDIMRKYVEQIGSLISKPWNIMEVCGGQTHAILRFGINQLLNDKISFLHGPGCPVCVTAVSIIDMAINLASRDNSILCSYGDMVRVPGSQKDLLSIKAEGGDVRIIYSPLDSLKVALDNPSREVILFAIGFETTAPANALTVYKAERDDIENFSVLSAQVLIPPAIEQILQSADHNVDGLLAPGHVCTITGYKEYEYLASTYNIPIVITGFEPLDILQGVYMLAERLEDGEAGVFNQYSRVVNREGNKKARNMIDKIFKVCDREWRGLGKIPQSGLAINEKYSHYDAETRFQLEKTKEISGPNDCIAGLVLQGMKKPHECPAFGGKCTPERPLGAPMVSAEGACAAYYRYSNFEFENANMKKISDEIPE